ncbi:MAG: hypothetical protein ACRC7O_03195 [Fimbriiglobus sp.]
MPKVVMIDEVLRAKFAADEPVEVIAADGTRVGYFTPTPGVPVRYTVDPGISDEELARRAADTTSPTYTTDEVLAHLRTL